MKDNAYDQHSQIALKAQEIIDYLGEKRRERPEHTTISAEVNEQVRAELEVIKRLAVEAHERSVRCVFSGLTADDVSEGRVTIVHEEYHERKYKPSLSSEKQIEIMASTRTIVDELNTAINEAKDDRRRNALILALEAYKETARAEYTAGQ